MSNEARATLAAALSTVDDCKGYATAPTAPRTGDGWALWGGAERWDTGGPFINTWRVVVVLPSDEVAADTWIAGHLEDLIDALTPVAHVDSAAPALAQASGNDAYRLQITVREP